jgi:hypothetical protein
MEMRRIRQILDRHAYAKDLGMTTDSAPLIQKAYRELESVVERLKKLDHEFWGSTLSQ